MNEKIVDSLEQTLKIKKNFIKVVIDLLSEGNTVPFIARYRKDQTGNLNEDQIRLIEKEFQYEVNLANRREEVMRLIDEKKMLSSEIKQQLKLATKLQTIEDIYLPFKEKRKTKATEAIQNGFEPLATLMRKYPREPKTIEMAAQKLITEDYPSCAAVIEQASYIIAEQIAENAKQRDFVRRSVKRFGMLEAKIKRGADKKEDAQKFEIYFDFKQSINKLPSYRILAVNRGEKAKILNVKITVDDENIINNMLKFETKPYENDTNQYMLKIVTDSFKRLIFPSIERELRKELTQSADKQAIALFSDNLEKLITEAPLKDKVVLGVDPAYRTGCKLAVVDEKSMPLEINVIYQNKPHNKVNEAIKILKNLCQKYQIEQIVIGNGTASRETEKFFKDNVDKYGFSGKINIVSEAGASVYSASKVAKEEFADLQVEERSAISIARRIQDPMAELVKIDPKAIGVGQYQHDVNQKDLAESLDFVMIKAINQVGVNVNTASKELLKYVSGLDATTAKNILLYRNEFGKFTSRMDLIKVKRLGPKAFEQAAGFLKIIDGKEVLDQTFIHPESYALAKAILKCINADKKLIGTEEIKKLIEKSETEIMSLSEDRLLIKDIIKALITPNVDFRQEVNAVEFTTEINKISDVKVGMQVAGQVRNIVEFGAFVDIGIKNDGLVHISELANNFVKDVRDVVNIGDIKEFTVIDVNEQKGKVQLSLKEK